MNAVARPLLLQLIDTNATGRDIAISVAGYDIRGQLTLDGASLQIDGREGRVSASRASITSVTINGHGLRIGTQQVDATELVVAWGREGLRIDARQLSIGALQLIGDSEPLEGTFVIDGIALSDLVVGRDDVSIGQLRVAKIEADAKLPARAEAGSAPPESRDAAPGLRDWLLDHLLPVLDRLTGHVNVDLGLDLTVPVIGRRRATHPFRIPIDAGTIDYRRLEDNLSTLEDALLDFSVRDPGLVLEVGIPFVPTRGMGKPIVTWSLSGEDLELARQQRVRLTVLARPDRKSDEGGEEKSSPLALRKAALRGLDVSLSIAPASDSPIHRVGQLVVTGELTYADGEAPEGAVHGGVQDVEIGELAMRTIRVAGARLDSASEVELAFVGVTPARVRAVVRSLQIDGFGRRSGSVEADYALAELREVSRDARI